MDAFANVMNGTAGRAARVILGLILIYAGLSLVGGIGGAVLAVVGIVPIMFGAAGRCIVEFLPGAR